MVEVDPLVVEDFEVNRLGIGRAGDIIIGRVEGRTLGSEFLELFSVILHIRFPPFLGPLFLEAAKI